MTWRQAPGPELSAEQARFALDHGAYIGFVMGKETVTMYRDERGTTHRWLVDRAGHVVQEDTFPRMFPAE
jgi:hypothetical protein